MNPENKDQAQVTRRTILRGAAVAASAIPVLLAGVSAAHAKASQKAVAYQDTPKGEQSCANCRVFEPPSSCKTVEGPVSPNGWCKIYIKK
jgi:High potential iron-sulfur protein